jgi:hypothetical protein
VQFRSREQNYLQQLYSNPKFLLKSNKFTALISKLVLQLLNFQDTSSFLIIKLLGKINFLVITTYQTLTFSAIADRLHLNYISNVMKNYKVKIELGFAKSKSKLSILPELQSYIRAAYICAIEKFIYAYLLKYIYEEKIEPDELENNHREIYAKSNLKKITAFLMNYCIQIGEIGNNKMKKIGQKMNSYNEFFTNKQLINQIIMSILQESLLYPNEKAVY